MSKKSPNYDEWIKEAEQHDEYHTEGAILEFTEELIRTMKRKGISRSQLATKLGKKPAYITKMLGGENNFTLATMVKVARALDMQLKVGLEDIPAVRTRVSSFPSWNVISGVCELHEPSYDYSTNTKAMVWSAKPTMFCHAPLATLAN